jgi:Protein of unknown function (DUF3352)
MPAPVKPRLVLSIAVAATALGVAGCGSSDGSGADPATLAPPKAPLYIEATLQPEGELKSNIQSLAKSVAGIDDLGDLILSSFGRDVDYEKEVEPWLGKEGGLSFESYDGDDFTGYGFAVQSTDTAATQSFIDEQAGSGDEPVENGTYQGVDYKAGKEEGTTIGVIGDFLAIAEDTHAFKAMVDAADGESLADGDDFASAIAAAPSGSFANVFVDVGGLIEQSGGSVDPDAKQFLDSAGIDPTEATAVASLIPGSDQVEIDVSSDLGGENPPSGDASKLLGSLPGGSFAAFASAEFGKRFGEAIDGIDENGIPGEIPPNELKSTMKAAGIDLDKIAASVGDLGVFAQGNTERNLTGAVVLDTQDEKEATNTVANIGLLLRASGTPGVTALSGKASGFSVRSPDLGRQPLIVAAEGERIAISYGLAASAQALSAGKSATLAADPAYEEAVAALGSTPISGFVDGPAALQIASALVPADEEGFKEAKPYLTKVDYVALGSGSSEERTTAKLIVGVGK